MWIRVALYSVFTTFQAIVQIILLPQIFNWSEDTDYVDNGAENSLLSVMF